MKENLKLGVVLTLAAPFIIVGFVAQFIAEAFEAGREIFDAVL